MASKQLPKRRTRNSHGNAASPTKKFKGGGSKKKLEGWDMLQENKGSENMNSGKNSFSSIKPAHSTSSCIESEDEAKIEPPPSKLKNLASDGTTSTENSSDDTLQILCDSSSSQGGNIDNQVNSFRSSSEGVGISMPTLKDSNGTSYKDLSGESDTDDTTSNSDPLLTVSTESLQSTNPLNRKQLLFLFKCETTGRSHYDDRIIEIASVVIVPDNLTITQTEFSSLCHTLHCICSDACIKHGITEKMLVDQPSFSVVFRRFLEWINKCIKEACCNGEFRYYPVLVAHDGFRLHYYFLMSEVNRHNLEESFTTVDDLWFADTLHDIRRRRNFIFPNQSWQRLGLVDLFRTFFPNENFQDPRRAMEDLQALRRVFTVPALAPVLAHLTIKPKIKIREKWYKKWVSRPYIDKMGSNCTESMAVSLSKNKVSYEVMEKAFATCSPEEFDTWLKKKGVKQKKQRSKIQDHFLLKYSNVIFITICTYLLCVCLCLYRSIEP